MMDLRRFMSIEDMRFFYEQSYAKYNGRGWQEFGHWGTKTINPTWGNVVKQGQLVPKASNISVGANKPLRSTSGWESYGGSIYKMGHGVAMDENDMLRMRAMASGNQGKFTDMMLDTFLAKADILTIGIHNQITSLAYKALSEAYIYDRSDDGIVIKENAYVPSENKIKVTDGSSWFNINSETGKWTANDAADPIGDMIDAQRYADNLPTPVRYDHWKMSKKLYDNFISHPKVVEKCRARINGLLNDSYILTESQILQYIHELGVMPILVIDEKSAVEIDGVQQIDASSFCETNMVLCQSGTNLFEVKPMSSLWEDVSKQAELGPDAQFSFVGEQGIIAILNTWDVRQAYNRIEAEAWATPVLTNPKNILLFATQASYVWKTDENIESIING